MNPDSLEGKAKNGAGRVEQAVGDVLGDPNMQAEGAARQFEGAAQDALGAAKETAAKLADQTVTAVSKLGDQAGETYEALRGRARDFGQRVDPLVKERPYVALGLAALAGLVLGVMLFGGGPKVIYIKPART